jgi:hypothetical protein
LYFAVASHYQGNHEGHLPRGKVLIPMTLASTDFARCKVLTWQELSAELAPELRKFLEAKCGIV